jgi:hypothetical protein
MIYRIKAAYGQAPRGEDLIDDVLFEHDKDVLHFPVPEHERNQDYWVSFDKDTTQTYIQAESQLMLLSNRAVRGKLYRHLYAVFLALAKNQIELDSVYLLLRVEAVNFCKEHSLLLSEYGL